MRINFSFIKKIISKKLKKAEKLYISAIEPTVNDEKETKSSHGNLADIDRQILIIQRSTRTTFRAFGKLHNHLRSVSKAYYNWHLHPYHEHVHWGALALTVLAVFSSIFSTLFSLPSRTQAATYTKTWDTKLEFETDATVSQVDTTTSEGSVLLAANPAPAPAFEQKFGSAGTGDSQFGFTWGIATDSAGDIYVVDRDQNRVQIFNADGTLSGWIGKDSGGGSGWHNPGSGLIGASGSTDGAFKQPYGAAVGPAGKIYVVEYSNSRVQITNADGTYNSKFGSAGTGDSQFTFPYETAVDTAGKIYVAESYRISIFSAENTFLGWIGKSSTGVTGWHNPGSGLIAASGTEDGAFDFVRGMAVDSAGKIYVSDGGNKRVQVFNADGTFVRKFGSSGSGDGQFTYPYGIAVDSSGATYIADDNDRINVFNSSGTFTGWLGKDTLGGLGWHAVGSGKIPTSGTDDGAFNNPRGVAVDSSGNIYVADTGNDRVQTFTGVSTYYSSGTISGTGMQTDAGGEAQWSSIAWSASSVPAGTDIKFKVRTSANGSDWTAWSDFYTDASAPYSVDLAVADSQYSEIQITLTGGSATPTLDSLTLTYVVNAPPVVSAVTATQSTTEATFGKVNVGYTVADSDSVSNLANIYYVYSTGNLLDGSITATVPATTGTLNVTATTNMPASGTVFIDNEAISYTGKGDTTLTGITRATLSSKAAAHSDQAAIYTKATTTTGDGSQATGVAGTEHTGTWDVGTDLPNVYLAGVVLRVIANDSELANMVGVANSAGFAIDTKDPVAGGTPISIDAGATKINDVNVSLILSATDDSTKQVAVAATEEGLTTWEAYSTPYAFALAAGDGVKTVYVKYRDVYGNETTTYSDTVELDTVSSTPSGATLFDVSDPALSNYQLMFTWTPVIDADFSMYSIERSIDGEDAYNQVATFTNKAVNAYADKSLSTENTYYYRIRSQDDLGNWSAYTDAASMQPAGTDQTPPSITGPEPSAVPSDTHAVISWLTNENADSFVEFGEDTDYGTTQGIVEAEMVHLITLIGLNPGTTYHYRIRTRDTSDNLTVSADYTFTTKLAEESAETTPTITGATAQRPGADPEEVTIIWTTDRYASSQVLYGIDENNIDRSTTEDSVLNMTHYVTVTGLKADTKYYYQPRSKDSLGHIVLGEKKYFVTAQTGLATPTISSVEATDITLNSAIISWETDIVTSSILEYGLDKNYGSKVEDQSTGSTTKHVVRLKDLTTGTSYHFRVSGVGASGTTIASDDYKLQTQTLPAISGIAIKDISSNGVTVTWMTNIEADSFVDYATAGTESQSQGRAESVKEHAITVSGLIPATEYSIVLKSRDAYGNSATSAIGSFDTIIDVTPPKINNLKSETSIITDANGVTKAQAIVSWSTDEPSTTLVKYNLGVITASSYTFSTTEDTNLTTSHVVIIPNLSVSSTYHLIAISKDASNNIGTSGDYTILTLNQDKTLLQYVVQILEQRFFWLKGMFN